MSSPLPLLQVSPNLKFMVVEAVASSANDLEMGWAQSGLTVRRVRGDKMRTYQGLFDEFAAALQFPSYFGENSSAFDECLTDLSWLPPQSGYVLVVTEPGEVLADAGSVDDLAWLVRSLTRAQAEWASPVDDGEWWDRPAVPFHVVLQCAADERSSTRDRWVAAGAELVALPL